MCMIKKETQEMLIVLIPLIGLILSLFARFLGKKAATTLSILSVIITFFYALSMSLSIFKGYTYVYSYSWIILENLSLNFSFLLDPLSISMSMLITFITSLVMIYSLGYIGNDPSIVRFLAFFVLFDLCMLLMVTSGNYVQCFLGWEGVGLTSYLLISFWHMRTEANKGALKAVVVNRVGDVFFMFALGIMWALFKSFDFSVVFSCFPYMLDNTFLTVGNLEVSGSGILAFCLLGAACAKSAQFLLHTWLPDAMEGPTPVSSLLHSATMVTAGIFVIIRSSFIFTFTPYISKLMLILGILTALISALIGMSQYDLKRIIAYSTCSQLGFMMLACGLGYYNVAFFHLITHAFFKCLLFLCSGSIIHALNDQQDIRKMGGLFNHLPFTFACMTAGTLALTGFPFMAGYYSKDLILETAFTSDQNGTTIFLLASLAAFLTAFYSMRSLYLVFFTPNSAYPKTDTHGVEEPSLLMALPMFVLTVLAIIAGYAFQGFYTTTLGIWGNSIALPTATATVEHEYIPIQIKMIPTILSFLGLLIGYLVFSTNMHYKLNLYLAAINSLTNQKFYIDQIYNQILAKGTTSFGYKQYVTIDRGYLETFGPWGLIKTTFSLQSMQKFHNGFITHIILIILTGVITLCVSFTNISTAALIMIFATILLTSFLPNTRIKDSFPDYKPSGNIISLPLLSAFTIESFTSLQIGLSIAFMVLCATRAAISLFPQKGENFAQKMLTIFISRYPHTFELAFDFSGKFMAFLNKRCYIIVLHFCLRIFNIITACYLMYHAVTHQEVHPILRLLMVTATINLGFRLFFEPAYLLYFLALPSIILIGDGIPDHPNTPPTPTPNSNSSSNWSQRGIGNRYSSHITNNYNALARTVSIGKFGVQFATLAAVDVVSAYAAVNYITFLRDQEFVKMNEMTPKQFADK